MFFENLRPDLVAAVNSIHSTDFPYPRSGHRLVAHEENLYSIGGYNPDLIDEINNADTNYPLLKEVWSFNIPTKKWSKLTAQGVVPEQLVSHSVVVHNNDLLVFGGTSVPFGQSNSNDLHVFNLDRSTWSMLPCTGIRPQEQYGHAAVINDDDLYIIGGTTGFEYNMDVFLLNLNDPEFKWKQLNLNTCKASRFLRRYRHEAVFYKNFLIVFGGGTPTEVCSLSVLDGFDLPSGLWTTVSPSPDPTWGCPSPRRCHSLARFDNFVYLSGGTDGRELFDDLWRYDLANNCWTQLPTQLPEGVFFHSTTVAKDDCLYSFGGVLNLQSTERSCHLYQLCLSPLA